MNFTKSFFPRHAAAFFLAAVLPVAASASSEIAGVGNFQKVDDHVYRGAQPTDEGFRNLAKLGIVTVINLREAGQGVETEAKMVKAAGMHFVSVPMKGMQTPSDASVSKVLAFLEDTSSGPVFVHCLRGADRTGGVIACYRIEHDHWQNDRAVAEARSLGMSWYQRAIQHYVLGFQPRTNTSVSPALEAVAPAAPPTIGPLAVAASSIQ